jgi:transposase
LGTFCIIGRYRRFVWPITEQGSVKLAPAQLSMLLEGIDWRARQRTWQPFAGRITGQSKETVWRSRPVA